MYKIYRPFRTPFHLLVPTYNKVMGVEQKTYTDAGLLFASVRGVRSEEKDVDKLEQVSSMRTCQSIYSSLVNASTVLLDANGKKWEVVGEPENIREGGHFLQFKIRRMFGGA